MQLHVKSWSSWTPGLVNSGTCQPTDSPLLFKCCCPRVHESRKSGVVNTRLVDPGTSMTTPLLLSLLFLRFDTFEEITFISFISITVHLCLPGGDTSVNNASICANQTRCGNCIAAGCYWCKQQV